MTDPAYTDEAALISRGSVLGVNLRDDDDGTSSDENEFVPDCIDRASATIDLYCATKYSQTSLAGSRIIKKLCTDLALWELCARRMNPVPSSVESAAAQAMEELAKIQEGTLALPGVARSIGAAPAVINQRVVLRRFPASRTEQARSSDLARKAQGYTRPIDSTAEGLNGAL